MKKLLLFLIISFMLVIDISAIPAFARKYKMSCQTCHAPVPRLKEYGDEFAGNGFKLDDKDAPRYFVNTGDDELGLIRDFPLAVRLDAYVTYRNDKPQKGDYNTPYLLKLMSGGDLSNDISYYFYFYMDERGEVAGVEDAYLMFNNMFGTELDLYVGQFQVSDPLFKRELRLTLEDYLLYKQKVGTSQANLAYDRGVMLTYGFETGTDLVLEIVNGNGLVDADALKNFDNDKFKNFAGRVSQDIGDFARIGGFVYYGEEEVQGAVDIVNDQILIFGPDFTVDYKDILQLNAQYLQRLDSEVYQYSYSTAFNKDVETKSAMAELIYTPGGFDSKWYGAGLFNWSESDYKNIEYKTMAGQVGYLLRRNIRIGAEARYDFTDEFMLFSVGIVSAF